MVRKSTAAFIFNCVDFHDNSQSFVLFCCEAYAQVYSHGLMRVSL